MTGLGQLTGLLLLCGWTLGDPQAIAYRFVNTLSGAESSPALPLPVEGPLLRALDTAGIQCAVRHLAAPEMEGRRRGTPGNARARAYIHAWEAGAAPTAAESRELALMALRLQAAVWHPSGWRFALW